MDGRMLIEINIYQICILAHETFWLLFPKLIVSAGGKHNLPVNRCFDFPGREACTSPMSENCKETKNSLKMLMRLLQALPVGLHLQDFLRLKAVGERFVGKGHALFVTNCCCHGQAFGH